jgi:anti-anti-sigma factor
MNRSLIMSQPPQAKSAPHGWTENQILCGLTGDGRIALVRIRGRGCSQIAPQFSRFAESLGMAHTPRQFVFDLAECEMMDSTFLGVLASVAATQQATGAGLLVCVNTRPHMRKILDTVGLSHLMEVRDELPAHLQALDDAEVAPVAGGECSRVEQICLCLQAHRNLADLGEENRVRFQPVIEYLEQSLEREKQREEATRRN